MPSESLIFVDNWVTSSSKWLMFGLFVEALLALSLCVFLRLLSVRKCRAFWRSSQRNDQLYGSASEEPLKANIAYMFYLMPIPGAKGESDLKPPDVGVLSSVKTIELQKRLGLERNLPILTFESDRGERITPQPLPHHPPCGSAMGGYQ